MKIKTKLSPPWITFVNEVIALFGQDPKIHVDYQDNAGRLVLWVEETPKAEAVASLLPGNIDFGGHDLDIEVVPPNGAELHVRETPESWSELFETAFAGNPIFAYVRDVDVMHGFSATYVVFKKKVVQFFIDNLADAHGVISTLYQEIAEDILSERIPEWVFFCTDVDDASAAPAQNWP